MGSSVIGDVYKLEERGMLHYVPHFWFFECHESRFRAWGLFCGSSHLVIKRQVFDFNRYQASLLGAVLAPVTGGVMANYFSWRLLQYTMAMAGVIGFTMVLCFLPETSHPGERGIDKCPESEHGWVWLNPFRCMWLLRSPNLLALVNSSHVIMWLCSEISP